ncbi:MAG: glycosyltransferase involved in cell wall biosynthesis [Myxococcota bacterium]|jgi:glycosyltransferase involved in cell wall biosynthesis
MARPLRILYLSHGYPPSERAGTEQHTRTVAEGMAARGHAVAVLAATRAPGRSQYSTHTEALGGVAVTRLVNNVPTRPLADGEIDRAVEQAVTTMVKAHRPDLVHLQHVAFLSAGLRFSVPTVFTLHDAWGWCASGGTELLADGSRCPGPQPARCAVCHAQWRPVPTPAARTMLRLAGVVAPILAPERLHRLWSRVPARIRRPIAVEGHRDAEPAEAAAHRNASLAALLNSVDLRLAPSRYLAARAEAMGMGAVAVIPHGIAPMRGVRLGGGDLLFLGTVSPHKGPDVVVEAWRKAVPSGTPGLRIHGPVSDPDVALGHPVGPVLDRAGVASALSEARVLVMGSRWAENAPLVIGEARSAGCPVIAPDIGGIPELVEEGVDGWLYPVGDVDALADRITRLLAEPPLTPRPPPDVAAMLDALEVRYRALVPR